ncbi:carbamoyltransferase C-terminal domain-containing protein [Nonomuraea fuscirosea]|uniref:carbamoyltransferase C-terminal domain-containing protein n=1 Tax=Nonomuraea fuscirosea TaxID=1291556 RepID=UPI0033CF620F
MPTRIIGINLSHDSSVCLVEDGRVVSALALERTTRVKRGTVPLSSYAPAMADLTGELVAAAGLAPHDVDYWIATSTESRDEEDERRLASVLGLLVPAERQLALPHPGHHLAHAAAAFHSSGFDEAVAVVVDAYGSLMRPGRERESVFVFGAGDVPRTVLRHVRDLDRIAGHRKNGRIWIPEPLSGIGELYRVVTLALGFNESGTTYDDAGKTMGLSSYGRRLSDEDLFIRTGPDGISFDGAVDSLVELGLAARREDGLRLIPRAPDAPLQDFHKNLAAQIQSEFEEACLYLTRQSMDLAGTRSLVLSGGCFLNSLLNTRIARETEVERLFVYPAATDDGNAVGAALYAYHHLIQESARTPQRPGPPLRDVFLGPPRLTGPGNTPDRIPRLAESWRHPVHRHDDLSAAARAAAEAIARGEIVGWFQDRAEFGPRALGARSILCHPGIAGMKDRLNARVKFRESFRPFAASALAEHAHKWFDMPAPDAPFMLTVCPVLPAQCATISEVVHVDGTCRIQTVDADLPGGLRELIEHFEDATGLPLVLNTSFNLRGMPLVERPEEALDCLFGSRLDRLFVGAYEFAAPDFTALRPVRERGEMRLSIDLAASGSLLADEAFLTSEATHSGRVPRRISVMELRLLDYADGATSLGEIADRCGLDRDVATDMVLELRRHGLLRWSGLPGPSLPTFPVQQYVPTTSDT